MSHYSVSLRVCIAVAFLAACGPQQDSASRALLDLYAPGIRLNQTIGEARSRDTSLFFPTSGSANYQDTTLNNADGFRTLVLRSELPTYDDPPDSASPVTGVELWSESARSSDLAVDRITRGVGRPPTTACTKQRDGTLVSTIWYWPARDVSVYVERMELAKRDGVLLSFRAGQWNAKAMVGRELYHDCPG